MKNKYNEKINLKDFIFLAVLSAVLLLASSLIMPLVMFTQIMALRQLLAAPVFAIFVAIALYKVPKKGALFVVGLITGLALLPMSIIMLLNNVIGALFIELIVYLLFRSYEKSFSVIFAAGLYMPATLPISLMSSMILKGKTINEMMGSTFESIFIPIASILLGLAGATLGVKIAKELIKAGKLK